MLESGRGARGGGGRGASGFYGFLETAGTLGCDSSLLGIMEKNMETTMMG